MPDAQTETSVYADAPGVGSRLSHTIDFKGRVTYYVYDDTLGPAFGRLTAQYFFTNMSAFNSWKLAPGVEHPDQIVSYAYDVYGNQTSVLQDFDGNLSTTTDQRESAYTYDLQGRLISAITAEGTIHHEYHAVTGLLTRTWSSLPGESSVHTDTQYAYDALGRLSTVTVATQHGQSLGSADVTLYGYNAAGSLSLVTLPNGIHTQYVYDNLNRLVSIFQFEDAVSSGTAGVYDTGVDTLIASYAYELDAAGNRISSVEVNDLSQVTIIDWQYDALNRLVYESYDSFDNTADYTLTFGFDLTSNRLIQSKWTSAEANLNTTAAETTLYTYNDSDQLLVETLYVVSTATTVTTYTYTATEQPGKAVVNVAAIRPRRARACFHATH